MTDPIPASHKGLDLRVTIETPLRQFVSWLAMVMLVSFVGYPGVICVTPVAWLIALRVGNLVVWRSKSELRSQRLIEASIAGGILGLLQGILFIVVIPFMGPIQANEITNTFILVSLMLIIGILASAGLSFFTAFLNENRRI